jgi:3-oxoacyl-(acyl-carrier-protein) synthase
VSSTVQSLQTQAQQRIEQSPIGVQLKSVVGSLAQPAPVIELTSVAQTVPVNLVPITISADDLADVQALLAAKQQEKQ